MKEINVCNPYVKGVSTILHDYLPGVFPVDCLSCEAEALAHEAYSHVKWSLKVLLDGQEHCFTVEDGLEIVPEDGMIRPFSKEIITPLILIERRDRLIATKGHKSVPPPNSFGGTPPKGGIVGNAVPSNSEESHAPDPEVLVSQKLQGVYPNASHNGGIIGEGDKQKYMDLDDFFVIRGAYLAKVLMIASLIMESFFKSENEGKSEKDIVKKPEYFLRDAEEIARVNDYESFRMKLAMTLNHTLRGTETFPLFLEDASGVIKRVRSIKCHGFLPVLVKNKLHLESEKRKIVYHSEKVSKMLRLPHFSHLGKIDMLETPESESIGLTLFLARGAEYDPASLEIHAPERDLLLKNPELAFSLSSSCVPFLNHSDGPRVSMGGKNLKQAIPVMGSQLPLIKTGVEETAGLDFGVNALVGYMLYEGLNFEDGLVISRSFAQKMAVTKIRDVKSAFLIDFFKKEPFDTTRSRGDFKFFRSLIGNDADYRYRVTYRYRFRGAVQDGDPLLTMSVEKSKLVQKGERGKQKTQYSKKWVQQEFSIKERDEVKSYTTKVLVRHKGLYPGVVMDVEMNLKKLDYAQVLQINGSDKKTHVESCEVVFKVEEHLPFEIGDKITGRHGNKATVSKIVPDDEMPKVLIDGKVCVLDALISPMSVMSRMNLGQLLEVHASVAYGEKTVTPFEPVDQKDLLNCLMDKGADEWGYFKLEDGRRIAAGYQYMVRLDHCVRNKLHVVKNASVSELNAQPLKGRKRFGGQRIGEMEFWTLFNHGAFNVIEDFARTNLFIEDERMRALYSEFREKHTQMLNGLLTMTTYGKTDSQGLQKSEDFRKGFFLATDSSDGNFQSSLIVKDYDRQFFKENYDPEIFNFMNKKKNKKKAFKLLKGKDGYLRKHMLGRRIHFSGRSTISPVPELDIDHVFLPVDFGIEWFGELIGLDKKFSSDQIKRAKQGDASLRKQMASKLTEFANFSNFLVILNRQPSLHRHSMQAFFPEFWEHYSIGLPTMVCEGFGADFDGDTMACYFPASQLMNEDDEMRQETHQELLRMLPTNLPYRLGDRDLAWSNGQDFAFGQYEIDQTGKNGVQENIAGIVRENEYTKALNQYNKRLLKNATEGELSISFFDIATPLDGEHPGPFLSVFKVSGARGKDEQFDQMAKGINILGEESGKNFGTGLDLADYVCTRKTDHIKDFFPHPIAVRSRRNLMEKKLSVASAGYFTRKLVSFLYPYVVKTSDCGTDRLLEFTREQFESLKGASKGNFSLKRLILGRYIRRNGSLILVDESVLSDVENEDWQRIEMCSPVTCACQEGVCSKCYGADLSRPIISEETLPGIGDFVGLSSGHSLGEFGTQLSMKTFQTGTTFTPDELSRLFFFREKLSDKNPSEGYYEYLLNIANQKAGDSSLFDAIGTFSVHLEIMYGYMVQKGIHSEAEMKKMFKKIDEMGLLSSLSFESFEGIFKKVVLEGDSEEHETVEVSPSVGYMFADPVIKKVINNG
ncbi:MAG: hypothetical protein U9N62_06460 [Thermotogota bacterium]|nr:hypothetical protein [Thermotogota bacterium]